MKKAASIGLEVQEKGEFMECVLYLIKYSISKENSSLNIHGTHKRFYGLIEKQIANLVRAFILYT